MRLILIKDMKEIWKMKISYQICKVTSVIRHPSSVFSPYLLPGKYRFIVSLKLPLADGIQLAFQQSFSKRAHFVSKEDTVEVIIFMLYDPCLITIKYLIMELPVLIIIIDPDM